MPIRGIHIANMGNRRAREIQGAAVMGQQRFDHIGVMQRFGPKGINRCHHRRQGIRRIKLRRHDLNHVRVQKRLVPLHVNHSSPPWIHRLARPGHGHQGICNRSDALTAGTAVRGSHQHRKTPALSQLTQLFTVGAEHDSVQIPCFTTAFKNPLDHQLAADIRQQFIRQSRGFEPRRNRRNALDGARIFRRMSQCFSNHAKPGRDATAGSYQ